MGFRKSDMALIIPVPLHFNTINKDNGSYSGVDVTHFFKLPEPEVREEYNHRLVKVKGKKVVSHLNEANWFFWLNTIDHVEGYDDLPTNGNWKEYFSDAIGRIHVDAAVMAFNELIGAEEVEQEKKFEFSSAPLSPRQSTAIPTTVTKSEP